MRGAATTSDPARLQRLKPMASFTSARDSIFTFFGMRMSVGSFIGQPACIGEGSYHVKQNGYSDLKTPALCHWNGEYSMRVRDIRLVPISRKE